MSVNILSALSDVTSQATVLPSADLAEPLTESQQVSKVSFGETLSTAITSTSSGDSLSAESPAVPGSTDIASETAVSQPESSNVADVVSEIATESDFKVNAISQVLHGATAIASEENVGEQGDSEADGGATEVPFERDLSQPGSSRAERGAVESAPGADTNQQGHSYAGRVKSQSFVDAQSHIQLRDKPDVAAVNGNARDESSASQAEVSQQPLLAPGFSDDQGSRPETSGVLQAPLAASDQTSPSVHQQSEKVVGRNLNGSDNTGQPDGKTPTPVGEEQIHSTSKSTPATSPQFPTNTADTDQQSLTGTQTAVTRPAGSEHGTAQVVSQPVALPETPLAVNETAYGSPLIQGTLQVQTVEAAPRADRPFEEKPTTKAQPQTTVREPQAELIPTDYVNTPAEATVTTIDGPQWQVPEAIIGPVDRLPRNDTAPSENTIEVTVPEVQLRPTQTTEPTADRTTTPQPILQPATQAPVRPESQPQDLSSSHDISRLPVDKGSETNIGVDAEVAVTQGQPAPLTGSSEESSTGFEFASSDINPQTAAARCNPNRDCHNPFQRGRCSGNSDCLLDR